jgi:hypothetical protein
MTPSVTMFGVMSDRCYYFPHLSRRYAMAEYGMTDERFLDEHPEEAFADVQEIWDSADSATRQELLVVCQERLMAKIREMEEEYRQIDSELRGMKKSS